MKFNTTLDGKHHMMGAAVVVGYTTTYTIIAVSFNSARGELYSIQHYVIKIVIDLQWFSLGTPVSSNNKTDRHDITEILLKVALNTITLTPLPDE